VGRRLGCRCGAGWLDGVLTAAEPVVKIGDEGQDLSLTEAAEPLLAKLRDAAHRARRSLEAIALKP
jgi:hypothetical protein